MVKRSGVTADPWKDSRLMMIDLRWLLGAPYLDPILYTPTEEELNEIEIIWSSYVATLTGVPSAIPYENKKRQILLRDFISLLKMLTC